MKKLFCTLILFIGAIILGQAQGITKMTRDSAANKKLPILYIYRNGMSLAQQQAVFNALIKIQRLHQSFKTTTVTAQDNLYRIIKHKYRLVDDTSHHLTDLLKKSITAINRLKGDLDRAGDQLKLPQLPVRAGSFKTIDLTQYFDIYNQKAHLLPSAALALREPTKPSGQLFNTGALTAYQLTQSDLELFKKLITKSTYNQMLGRSIQPVDTSAEMVEVRYLGDGRQENISSPPLPLTTAENNARVREILNGLELFNFRDLYILDTFSGYCPHGNKVMTVIRSVIENSGLLYPENKIHGISVDYFTDVTKNLQIVKDFYGVGSGLKERKVLEQIKQLAAIDYLDKYQAQFDLLRQCKTCVPEVFIGAVFGSSYNVRPDVISTSFVVKSSDRGLMPAVPKSKTSLVTAALDANINIEDFDNQQGSKDSVLTPWQPLFDYYIGYDETAPIIVGARYGNGRIGGMKSKNGKRLTVFGNGDGWSGNCLQTSEFGTSFATPEIAAKLYIAKTFWRSRKFEPNADESRNRLLLATNLDSACVGKSGSAGNLNLEKFLQLGGGYVQTIDGKILPIQFLEDGGDDNQVNYTTKLGYQFKRAADEEKGGRICGLFYSAGKFYKFSEADLSWRPLKVTGMHLSFRRADGITENITDQQSFTKRYVEIVRLE